MESLGRVGTVFVTAEVPDFEREALSLSGIVLGRGLSVAEMKSNGSDYLLPVVPSAAREFTSAQQVTAFLRVYQGSGPLVSTPVVVRIVNERNDTVLDQKALLDTDRFYKSRAADVSIELPTARLAAGEYLLTVEASKASRKIRRQSRFKVK